MYNLDDVVKFIEKSKNIKLFDYQKKMLQYIIEGRTFYVPRHSGRTTVLEGYIDYLRQIHGKHITHGMDEHIGLSEVINENNWIMNLYLDEKPLKFELEYECDWFGKSDKT
jgi:hypothetical protein